MKVLSIKKAACFAVFVFAIIVFYCVVYMLRPTPGDLVDMNSAALISDYLEQSNNCATLAEGNSISSEELDVLTSLNKYEVLAYASVKEVEQELDCLSVPMSKLLYSGWLIRGQGDKIESNIDLEGIINQLVRTSIILSVDEMSYISDEEIKILDKIEFFKKPFVMHRSLLEEGG